MNEIRFIQGAPPERSREGRDANKWAKVVEQLKSQPGAWAIVADYEIGSVASRAAGDLKRKHGCEALSRLNQATRRTDVYARWNGERNS